MTPEGTFSVDALWRSRRVAAEAHGRAHDLGVQQWQDDLRRQNAVHGPVSCSCGSLCAACASTATRAGAQLAPPVS